MNYCRKPQFWIDMIFFKFYRNINVYIKIAIPYHDMMIRYDLGDETRNNFHSKKREFVQDKRWDIHWLEYDGLELIC